MKRFILLTIAVFYAILSFSQGIFSQSRDTVDKMLRYQNMLKIADYYKMKTEMELQKISFLKAETHRYFDSAAVTLEKVKKSKSNTFLLNCYNRLFYHSLVLLKNTDSIFALAHAYEDTLDLKNTEVKEYYLQLAQDFKPVISKDTVRFSTYIVLLGNNNIKQNYIDKINDVKKVAITINGEKRYVIGQFASKVEAKNYCNSMALLGYDDTYINVFDTVYLQ